MLVTTGAQSARLVDAPAAGNSVQQVIDRIEAKNIEAVVCDTSTPSIVNDVKVVEALRAARPALHVLLVGRHVSSLPRETLAMSDSLEAVAMEDSHPEEGGVAALVTTDGAGTILQVLHSPAPAWRRPSSHPAFGAGTPPPECRR